MRYQFSLLLLITFALNAGADVETQTLEPIEVLPLETVAPYSGLQPSGLAACGQQLLMVSDRHNHTIFTLFLEPDRALANEHLKLGKVPKPSLQNYDFGTQWWSNLSRRYDWEGISCEEETLFLLSETLSQVLAIKGNGSIHWLGDSAYLAGRGKGLFEQLNAKGEGLAIADGNVYIAAERQPRGLVKFSLAQPRINQAFFLNGFPNLVHPEDFAGLLVEQNNIYTLERNHFKACKRNLQNFRVDRCWSYAATEKFPEWRYQDQRFGKAEGIARIKERLYIVTDNNNGPRLSDPNDTRPLLMVFNVPKDW